MNEAEWMAGQFEEHRAHLRDVAFRMLGSVSDADDAVQEAWLRVSRADTGDVINLRGWLTTVVARIALNMLRARTTRREELVETEDFLRTVQNPAADAETEAVLADAVGLALLVVLERLTPAERLAFVLHDMFELPFEEIAPIVGRTPTAARQLASRARRRVQGADTARDADLQRRREVVEAFLSASRRGEFSALLALLDPDVELRVDDALRRRGAGGGGGEARGAAALIAGLPQFARAARFCRMALLDGSPGLIMAPRGRLTRAILFSFVDGKVALLQVIGDPATLRKLRVTIPEAGER